MLSNETLAGQWNETTWNLTTRLIQLHKMRMFSLFNNDIGPDDRDSTANIMKVGLVILVLLTVYSVLS